jgi:hypothetical protein
MSSNRDRYSRLLASKLELATIFGEMLEGASFGYDTVATAAS